MDVRKRVMKIDGKKEKERREERGKIPAKMGKMVERKEIKVEKSHFSSV